MCVWDTNMWLDRCCCACIAPSFFLKPALAIRLAWERSLTSSLSLAQRMPSTPSSCTGSMGCTCNSGSSTCSAPFAVKGQKGVSSALRFVCCLVLRCLQFALRVLCCGAFKVHMLLCVLLCVLQTWAHVLSQRQEQARLPQEPQPRIMALPLPPLRRQGVCIHEGSKVYVHQGKVGVLMHVAALFPLLYPHGISDLLHGCYMGAQPQPNSAQRIVPLPISLSLDACFYR